MDTAHLVIYTMTQVPNKVYCDEHRDIEQDLNELRTEIRERDHKILEAFQSVKKRVEGIRKDLDDKQIINNYNKREQDLLRNMDEREREELRTRVDTVGAHAEAADIDIYQQIVELKRLIIQILIGLFGLFGVLIAILTYFRI